MTEIAFQHTAQCLEWERQGPGHFFHSYLATRGPTAGKPIRRLVALCGCPCHTGRKARR